MNNSILLANGHRAFVLEVFPKMGVAVVRLDDGRLVTVKLNSFADPSSPPAKAGGLHQQPQPKTEDDRQVVQPSGSVMQNEGLAVEAAAELERRLARICSQVTGAWFARLRPMKNPVRAMEKVVREGKPAETIADYLAAQISADTVQAKDQLITLLRRNFRVVNVDDRFLQGRPDKGGYPSANVQVQMSNGLTAEVQIVPREVQEATLLSHHFYRRGREAYDARDHAEGDRLFTLAERINREAIREFKTRTGY